jgi:hypothetical protein
MPLPWIVLTATDMEEKALLSAAVGISVTAPVTYYAGVSTTQPTKPGAINEISGSGYARVQIPAWSAAFKDFAGPVVDTDYASPFFTAWMSTPISDVIFPDATAAWWSSGTTVYLFLADAASGGNVRWWMPIAPATAPRPGNPLVITTGNLAIGVARQDAESDVGTAAAVGVLAGQAFASAIDKLTGMDSGYAPTWYAGVGWGDYYDETNTFLSHHEPVDETVATSWVSAAPGFDYAGGGENIGSGTVRDADYVRKPLTWSAPAVDADGWYVANATDIVWTLGVNTVVSGTPIPPNPHLGDQIAWTLGFYQLGQGDSGSVAAWRGGRSGGHTFALWQQASGGKGGPPPSVVTGLPGDPVSGLKDDGGDIWGYPYCPSVTLPDPVPSRAIIGYPYADETQIDAVTPDGSGEFNVSMNTFAYTVSYFWVIYEDDGSGNFVDAVSGDVWDPARSTIHWLGWGTVFPPDGSHGGEHYYLSFFGTPDYRFPLGGVESSADNIFLVGDQVKIDAGAIKVRLR